MMTPQELIADLSVFSDLGTTSPNFVESGGTIIVQLIRNSLQTTLTIKSDGLIHEHTEDDSYNHANFRSLLASQNWANLAKWADSQRTILKDRVNRDTIPVYGRLAQSQAVGAVDLIDDTLTNITDNEIAPRTFVLLIDGPAGIGKTSLIRNLAYNRARNYRINQRPLILHVESRGRVLQYLTDLMAFSLQTLRVPVTYDQVPVLVRHGLVSIAIDGFDELGDPNGYDLAWAQVNELIADSRGRGQIVLAGRETFIGRERMQRALTAVDEKIDKLDSFTIRPIEPSTARSWLSDMGWSDALLESETVSSLFEPKSYALRPFFLSELSREGVAQQVERGEIGDLLSFLINAMIEREASKFGHDVDAVTNSNSRIKFISRLMEEVARDLAENQSNAIPSDTLSWLADVVAEEIVPDGLRGILKNRAGVLAFLQDDDRRDYKSFIHEQVYNHFLARASLNSIGSGEIPKYVRRNILGTDFLEVFIDVIRHAENETAQKFFTQAQFSILKLGNFDRAKQNLASLVISACCVYSPSDTIKLEDISIDDVLLTETPSGLHLKNIVINQMTALSADFRAIYFEDGNVIVTLIADRGTIPSSSCPMPTVLLLPDETSYDPSKISQWFSLQKFSISTDSSPKPKGDIESIGVFKLLARVARYKPFWIKDGDEKAARRILDDDNWPALKEILKKHDFLIERNDVPAAGRPAPFYHIKNRTALMNLTDLDETKMQFILDLLELVIEDFEDLSNK